MESVNQKLASLKKAAEKIVTSRGSAECCAPALATKQTTASNRALKTEFANIFGFENSALTNAPQVRRSSTHFMPRLSRPAEPATFFRDNRSARLWRISGAVLILEKLQQKQREPEQII
jgi:hypothetical protein